MLEKRIQKYPKLNLFANSIVNSYSQIFFSQSKLLGALIILCTFFEPKLGVAGIIGVAISNVIAYYSGFTISQIREGLFGFNALLLSLGLASTYQWNITFFILFLFAIVFNLINNVWINGILGKYHLPSLSFPFLITFWIISIAVNGLSEIHIDESRIYWMNEAYKNQGSILPQLYQQLESSAIPHLAKVYFKTLSGVFFLNNILAGIILSIGILIFSRIAFSLTVIGFLSAYYCYTFFGVNTDQLYYQLTGSNFIFTAIGIGCFYLVPNIYSYLTVIILTPITLFLIIFFNKILGVFQLTVFTLPFSFIVVAFLYFLRLRSVSAFLHFVTVQYYSAEKTVYKYLNNTQRYKNYLYQHIHLPFWGEWMVSQGYDGKITHLGDWSKALDFIVLDNDMRSFKDPGTSLDDFFCYNKPVLAPADGFIDAIVDTIEDNALGEVNTQQNWGNSLVIRHNTGLYTQLSHLKKETITVKQGDYVKRGDLIAHCGSSGRSPEPHLHFQVQEVPIVGAKTLAYPIAYYIQRENKNFSLRTFEVPEEGQTISNVAVNPLLANAFYLYPGLKLQYNYTDEKGLESLVKWEIFTDSYNHTYIYCHHTKSYAYFVNDGTLFYFTDFEGDKNSLLFYFYLAAYKVLLGYYHQLTVSDKFPLNYFSAKGLLLLQDFVAPFYQFARAGYTINYNEIDNEFYPDFIKLNSTIKVDLVGFELTKIDCEIELSNNAISAITIKKNNKIRKATSVIEAV